MKLDIIFKNAKIYDGLGNPPVTGNIGILDDKIVYPADNDYAGENIIELNNLSLSPGFINIHSHSEMAFLVDGRVPSSLCQGITTEVTGNCGYSIAPLYGECLEEIEREAKRDYELNVTWHDFKELFDLFEKRGISINTLSLVGHGTLRGSTIGMNDRPLTSSEMERMKESLAVAMEQGAFGLSTGLIYPPGCYAATEELIELASVLKEYGGFYSSHIRGEGDTLFEAIDEAISIGKKAHIPVEISHLKASGEKNWGKTEHVLEMIHNARKSGLFIQHDQYPYIASATGLSIMVPKWAHDGGTDGLIKRLKDFDTRKAIVGEMEQMAFHNGHNVLISYVNLEKNKKYEGREIHEIAREENINIFDFIIDLLIEEDGHVDAIYMSMDEKDVKRVMSDPYTSIGTDAWARAKEGPLFKGKPHPRAYGTFPRVLGHYSRDLNLFPPEEAIRKMTSLPAKMLGLSDRGIIRNGAMADLVVFNEEKINDMATFDDPHNYPEGIEYVVVNGKIVLNQGEILPVKPGRVIRNSGKRIYHE